jgi:opacity protein-like surface antigen
MKRITLIAGLLIALSSQAFAQEAPPVEVFAGYSYFRPDRGGNLHGWNASVTVNLNRQLAIVGDFSGHYGSQSLSADIFRPDIFDDDFPSTITIRANSDTKVHTFLSGPRFSYRGNEKVTPFAHVLFGVSHLGADATIRFGNSSLDSAFADTGFAMAIGGGLDMSLSESVGLRLIQADYVVTNFGGKSQGNVRLSFGFILR